MSLYNGYMKKIENIIDLTHPLSADIPSWHGKADFEMSTVTNYGDYAPPDLFRIQRVSASLSLGTHMDAPAHVIPGGRTIDQLMLEELVADCVVIDVRQDADEQYIAMPSVIEHFEKENGKIPTGSFVIFHTGWSRYWERPEKYHNDFAFPSVDISTAEILLERNIVGLGIDTFSCDTGKSGFPVHRLILGADKYLVENIANSDALPAMGAKICILPLKIKDATEAPVRLVAFL